MSGTSNQGWRSHAVPGSIKPVYGARYPPLNPQPHPSAYSAESEEMHNRSLPDKKNQDTHKFNKYNESVEDAWDLEEEGGINRNTASATANHVIALHALRSRDPHTVMVDIQSGPSRNSKQLAMQRLAIQKDPIPGSAVMVNTTGAPLYPRLPNVDTSAPSYSASCNKQRPSPGRDSLTASSSESNSALGLLGNFGKKSPSSSFTTEPSPSAEMTRYERLKAMLNITSSGIDLDKLKKDCWKGIPHKLRPCAWRILSGYLPSNAERREETLTRKREEYFHYVEQYFHTRYDDLHQDTFRQIHIDIPRMCPLLPLFQQKLVQEIFERILYIWAIRHPASGYVQGINDLVTPFFVVFLSEYVRDDLEVGTYNISQLKRESVEVVEADSFWCVSALLDTIQDNYTFAQPGIQRKISQLEHLVSRVDNNLHMHLLNNSVEYLQFAFRWMNNLLMREIPLRATVRLWDTYLSEPGGFAEFHVYVCAAFLRMWSKNIQAQKDFQSIMLLLQNFPTQAWSDQHICELTADAFSLMAVFAGAKNHLVNS